MLRASATLDKAGSGEELKKTLNYGPPSFGLAPV